MEFYLSDTYTLLLIFSIFIFSILMFTDKARIPLLLEYIINQKYALIYHRKDSFVYKLFVGISSLIILSILVSFYVFHINKSLSFYLFFKILLILLLGFILKKTILEGLCFIFEKNEYSKKYNYGFSTNIFFLSVLFSPFILFISYFNGGGLIDEYALYFFYIFLFFYFLLKIILLIRLNVFLISLMFYNILYFCSLELLPYFVLFELLEIIR